MILKKLRVEQFRRHNLPLEITFGDRLTVVSGPNEAGKSTLFEAMQYALFRRSGATGKDIDALMPWDRPGLSPTVQIEFAHGGSEYRLTKTWGKQGSSRIERQNAGGVFEPAMSAEADEFLAAIFSGDPQKAGAFAGFTGQQTGLAYLLFVPQGEIQIEGSVKEIALNESAGAKLSNIIGAAAQSSDEAKIAKKISVLYADHFTGTGKRKTQAPAAASERARTALETQATIAQRALSDFEHTAELIEAAELRAAEAKAEATQARELAAQGRPRVQQAVDLKGALERARMNLDACRRAFEDCAARNRRIETASRTLKDLEPKRSQYEANVRRASAAKDLATAERAAATLAIGRETEPDAELESTRAKLAEAQLYEAKRRELETLAQLILNATALADRVRFGKAELTPIGSLSEAQVRTASTIVERRRDLIAKLDAASTTLEISAERDLDLEWRENGEKRLALPEGETFKATSAEALSLRIEGVGVITVRGPVTSSAEINNEITECEVALLKIEALFGTSDPAALHALLDRKVRLESELARMQVELQGALGAETLDQLVQRAHDGRSELPAGADPARIEEFKATVAAKEAAIATVRNAEMQRIRQATEAEKAAVNEHTEAQAMLEQFLRGEWNGAQHELATLNAFAETDEQRRASLDAAFTKRYEAERNRDDAQASYQPFENLRDPMAELTKLEARKDDTALAAQEAQAEVRRLKERQAEAYAKAPADELREIEEKLAAADGVWANDKLTEEAIAELHAFVAECDRKRVENFAEPVLEKVRPWFTAITGSDLLTIDLTKHHEVGDLRIAGVARAVDPDELSFGTSDQLALLIRLAFASLLTAPTCLGTLPVLLDDPLVNADERRRVRIGSILQEIAETAQVVVFTCRPEDYRDVSARFVPMGSQVLDAEHGVAEGAQHAAS